MKITSLSLITLTAGLVFSPALLHAQTALAGSFNNDLGPVQPAYPDDIVQVTAEAEGLSQADSSSLPLIASCWWTVYPGGIPVPMPCPPQDLSVPIYEIASGIYLVDETGGAVSVSLPRTSAMQAATTALAATAVERQGNAIANLIEQVQETEFEQTMTMAFGMEVPSPFGGGITNGGSYSPGGSPMAAPDYGTNLWIAQTAVAAGYLTGIGTNTIADVEYEIQSRTNLVQTDWQSEGFIYGSELTNWTPLSVAQFSRTNLFIRLRSWADDGSGLPIWWQLQYFGTNGVDPYGDPAGDGWSNLQKFQAGMNPNQFYTPAAPQDFTASYNVNNGAVTLNWLPAPGPVTGYSLQKMDGQTGQSTNIELAANAVSYGDSVAGEVPDPYDAPVLYLDYSIQAQYGTNGLSASASASIENASVPQATILTGPQGRLFLAIPNLPGDLSYVQIYRQQGGLMVDFFAVDGWYGEEDTFASLHSPLSDGYFEIPASSVTNGICQLPDSQVPPFFNYALWMQTVRSNGIASGWDKLFGANANGSSANTPFVDARQQLKDNLRFLLRAAADNSPFAFTVNEGSAYWYLPPAFAWPYNNYVYSGFYGEGGEYFGGPFDVLHPIHANSFYRNFVYDQNNLDANGFLNTGCYGGNSYLSDGGGYLPCLTITNFPTYYFNLAGYLTNNVAIPSSYLAPSQTQWILPNDGDVYPLDGGIFTTGEKNFYGLPYLSKQYAYVNTNSQLIKATYYPGDNIPSGVNGVEYSETAQPVFTSAGYYFARPSIDPTPEDNGFVTTNVTQNIFQGVGSSQQIAGYAQLGIQNGYPDEYAYLGQYFDTAYAMTNGVATANPTGILSPYGNFFATEPGPVALVTMPDIDTGARGTGMVYTVGLVIDRNQGSNIDLSFTGADATSQTSPMQIWANNNYDRGHAVDGSDFEQDDLGAMDIAQLPAYQRVPDCNFVNASGQPAIPSTRDLEDYFRLWTPGLSAAMSVMPASYTVQLTLAGDGQIRIFGAYEASGGTNYLFDETTASNQVASSASLYVGLLTSGSPVVLTNRTNEHFIFCGAHTGYAQVDLQVLDGNQNVVADTAAYVQINDIKNMYERWTVGDDVNIPPMSVATNAANDMPDPTQPRFQYSLPTNTNTPYILFAHGWNMEAWEKDRYAEAAFKRLYWQGYKGRFGIFQWPTGNKFSGIISVLSDARNYDNSEYQAWQSVTGLTNLLTQLDTEYYGNVYLMAHSMGNVVAGEALRLANSQLVNTYIAMQGAVSAHCYDTSTPNRSSSGPPDCYAAYWTNGAPCYFNSTAGAGSYVNLYNTNDFALRYWNSDQDPFKPDNSGLPFPGYYYNTPSGTNFSGFYKIIGSVDYDLYFPQNTYEIFAYADRAWSYALGAQANVGGSFQFLGVPRQVNLPSVWPTDTHPQFNNEPYSAHVWHSAEFRSDNMSRAIFWNTVLTRMNISQ